MESGTKPPNGKHPCYRHATKVDVCVCVCVCQHYRTDSKTEKTLSVLFFKLLLSIKEIESPLVLFFVGSLSMFLGIVNYVHHSFGGHKNTVLQKNLWYSTWSQSQHNVAGSADLR